MLCGSTLTVTRTGLFDYHFGAAGVFNLATCAGCGLEQTVPRPTEQELVGFYEAHYNLPGKTGSVYKGVREWFFFSWFYKLWSFIDGDPSFYTRRGTGRLLDIGCNEGRGLQMYRRNGFAAEGMEFNTIAATQAERRGFKVYSDRLESFQPPHLYDVVVLANVIEHVLSPEQILKHIRRILRPGGQLWISCPNNQSWSPAVFGNFWVNWHVPYHIAHFSAEILEGLLSKAGFTVRVSQSETPALLVAQSIICKIFAKEGQPTRQLRNPILLAGLMVLVRVFLFPFLFVMHRLGKGDDLVVISEAR
jgi:2-polyprenyl-3-methyl-5-hydroxy-6-metoxy-1,4-benzoquinol methylase